MQKIGASTAVPRAHSPIGGTISLVEIAAFLIGAAQSIQLQLVGQLYAGELIALALLPILLLQRGAIRSLSTVSTLYLLAALWLGNAVVTDFYREMAPDDYYRGWSRIIFFVTSFTAIWLITDGRPRALKFLVAGTCLSFVGQYYISPDFFDDVEPWKFAFGPAALLAASLVGVSQRSWPLVGHRFDIVAISLIGLISLYFNSRSLFGIALMAAGYTWLALQVRRRPALSRRITPVVFGLLLLLGLLLGQGMLSGYTQIARSGLLGETAREKVEIQTTGDVNLIVGGRVETLVSTQAIIDSPIIGHGSWARDPYYLSLLLDRLGRLGLQYPGDVSQVVDYIPSHSHLLGSWVDHGVFGGLFWIWVLFMVAKSAYRSLSQENLPGTIVTVAIFWMLWDVIFSPFGADQRFMRAVQIAIILSSARYVLSSSPVSKHRGHA